MVVFGGVPWKCEKSLECGEISSADFVPLERVAVKTVPSAGLWGGAGHMSEMEGEKSDCSKQGMRDNLRGQASQEGGWGWWSISLWKVLRERNALVNRRASSPAQILMGGEVKR